MWKRWSTQPWEGSETMFDIREFDRKAGRIAAEFPILSRPLDGDGRRLVYLDSAATSQKPRAVIRSIAEYYETINSNVHRSIHRLGEAATAALESSRASVAGFIGAQNPDEIVFTHGTTESFNLLASSFCATLREGDEIILSVMEHHANIVPWQIQARERGIVLKFLDINEAGELDLSGLDTMLGPRTKLISLAHISNVLGTVNPVRRIADIAHASGALFALDAAQSAPHRPIDVRGLGADFLAFSGHKALGPMGIGILYGRRELLDALPPWQGGGEMIESVTLSGFTPNRVPYKFEAGTPNVEGAVGLKVALSYLDEVGRPWVDEWSNFLAEQAREKIAAIPGIRIFGDAAERGSILSFTLEGFHAHDLAAFLDARGIAVRAGHHCAHPLAQRLGQTATCRASFYLYNTLDDVDAFATAVAEAAERGGPF